MFSLHSGIICVHHHKYHDTLSPCRQNICLPAYTCFSELSKQLPAHLQLCQKIWFTIYGANVYFTCHVNWQWQIPESFTGQRHFLYFNADMHILLVGEYNMFIIKSTFRLSCLCCICRILLYIYVYACVFLCILYQSLFYITFLVYWNALFFDI